MGVAWSFSGGIYHRWSGEKNWTRRRFVIGSQNEKCLIPDDFLLMWRLILAKDLGMRVYVRVCAPDFLNAKSLTNFPFSSRLLF